MSAPTPLPFTGTLVVDLGGTVGTAQCGKLFADLGARVVDVEEDATSPQRMGLESGASAGAGAYRAYLAAGKESVGPGEGRDGDRGLVDRLCARADVVLAAPDLGAPGGGDALAALEELSTRTIVVSLTWFGHHGPYARYRGNEAVLHSLAGGVRNVGEAAGPPTLPAGHLCALTAGTTAFIAAAARLLARQLGAAPAGELLEVSVLDACMALVEPGTVGAYNLGQVLPRLGVNRFWPTFPGGIYRCREGWLGVTALTPAQWQTFCALLEAPELAADPRWQVTLERMANADLLDRTIAPRLLARAAREWFALGQERRLPFALVPTVPELLACEQFRARGAFHTIRHPDLGAFRGPGVPFRLDRTPLPGEREAPRRGAHTAAIRAELERGGGALLPASVALPATEATAWLRGLRVVDLTMGWAGPLATRHLADLGAEVIKVESCQHFDWWRGWEVTEAMVEGRLYEKSSAFLTANRNKLGITLDLTSARGAELLRQLAARADAVVENYAASVLPKLGLDYAQLAAHNRRLVMLSMPPFGGSGDWRAFRAYGSTVEQASGLPHLQGRADWPPTMIHVALGDPIAGITGAAALLAALAHRAGTGIGQRIDLSQVEAMFPFLARAMVEHQVNGAVPPRLGGRHPAHAPWAVYRCRGEERWLILTIESDQQWQAFRGALTTAALAPALFDPRFDAEADRKRLEAELDAVLAAFFAERDRDAAAHKLQRAGVPAAPVHDHLELLFDPHLEARGFWQWLERDFVGEQPTPSAPYRTARGGVAIGAPAPTLGQHTRQVLARWLALDEAELDALERDRIIGTQPLL